MGAGDAPVVRVLCGPTAAGKTRAAFRLAQRADLSIVSADSRQIYRGFDVGTAKPSNAEREAVPHYGVDVLDPRERASAAWWAGQADEWIRAAIADGRTPLVVGGTGLYLRALFGELFAEPPLDPAKREALRRELAPVATEDLRRRVEAIDPPRAALGRAQLLRAIEISELTGRRLSDLHRERRTTPRWRARYLLVDPGASLADRIVRRTRAMIAGGWRDEVRALADEVPADAPAWNASGYGAIRDLEAGLLTEDRAVERVVIETRQYAKRQRTWFRHQLAGADVTPFDDAAPEADGALFAWWGRGDA